MKKVFLVKTKPKNRSSPIFEWNIFSEDCKSASEKVEKYMDVKQEVISVEILCIVEEEKDLKEYLEDRE